MSGTLDVPGALDRLRHRDPEAISALVKEHARALFRAARGFGFRPDEAEDIVQDVFVVFLSSLDRFEGRSQLRTWLFGILHRKKLEKFRDKNKHRVCDPADQLFESQFRADGSWSTPPLELDRWVESRELGESLSNCIEHLPALQRSVFVLREMEGLKTEEVCKILDITGTHLGVLLHRARSRLRDCLRQVGWDCRQ